MVMNIDKFDIFFGLSDKTKEKSVYWIFSFVITVATLLLNRTNDTFLHLEFPTDFKGIALFGLTIYFLGLVVYSVVLGVMIVTDLCMFRTKRKKSFIDKPVLSAEQKEEVFKRFRVRKELYALVIKPHRLPYTLTDKQWVYYTSKIGNRAEVASKVKFLLWIEEKVKTDSPLSSDDLTFLNELLFCSDDVKLLSRLHNETIRKPSQ